MRATALAAFFAAAGGAGAVAGGVERLAWLQGCWEMAAGGRSVEEHWMAPRGGSMVGASRTVRAGALVEYELVLIRERGERLVYTAGVCS